MGLYFRDNSGSDICVSGNYTPGTDSGFNTVVVGNKMITTADSRTLKFKNGNNVSFSVDVTKNEITISSVGGEAIVYSSTEPTSKSNNTTWIQ